jgi:site-specific recombinase XerD
LSVYRVQRSNGKLAYKVRWREGLASRSRQFDRLQDAKDFGRRLSDYAPLWWSDYAEPNLTPRTLEVYATQLDLRIIPHLGGHRLREPTPAVVQELLARLGREGVGDPSIVKTATVLQSILNRAVIDGMIARNPVAVVRKPPQRRKRAPIMVPPATVELIRAGLGQRDATLVSGPRLRGPPAGG